MNRRRAAAVGSLAFGIVAVGVALALAVDRFPRGLVVLACLWVALIAGWTALRRSGAVRAIAGLLAAAALLGALAFLVAEGRFLLELLIVAALAVSLLLARAAFRIHVDLPAAPRPGQPVLFFNPLSGGGKATRFGLTEQAERRGIEPIELRRGLDLRELVEEAVAAGADALAMAGEKGRRRSSPTSPPRAASPSPACRRARATTSRSISASIATTWSARWKRSSRAASDGSTWPR